MWTIHTMMIERDEKPGIDASFNHVPDAQRVHERAGIGPDDGGDRCALTPGPLTR